MQNAGHYVTSSPSSDGDKSHLFRDQWPNDLHYENVTKQIKQDLFLGSNACLVALHLHFKNRSTKQRRTPVTVDTYLMCPQVYLMWSQATHGEERCRKNMSQGSSISSAMDRMHPWTLHSQFLTTKWGGALNDLQGPPNLDHSNTAKKVTLLTCRPLPFLLLCLYPSYLHCPLPMVLESAPSTLTSLFSISPMSSTKLW